MATISDASELIKTIQSIENSVSIAVIVSIVIVAAGFFLLRKYTVSEYVTGGKQNYDELLQLYNTLNQAHSDLKTEFSDIKKELEACKKEIQALKLGG